MSPPKAKYFIGIDGGGTQCRARLTTPDGTVIGEGFGGPTNIRLGLGPVWEHWMKAVDQCLGLANLERDILSDTAIGLGLAGITSPEDCLNTIKAGPQFSQSRVAPDAHVACRGAVSGKDGAILITGTGSVGYAYLGGKGHYVGGWGFEVSDDGSAASLGREALHASLAAFDGMAPQSPFTRAMLDSFGGHPSGIVHWVTSAKPKDYGSLAPMIMAHADDGDPVAVALVQHVAVDVGRYISRLHELGAGKICLIGGMAKSLQRWLSPWTHVLLAHPDNDAVTGALILAHGAGTGFEALP